MYLRRDRKPRPPQPTPGDERPVNGYVPGYLQQNCPTCNIPYCGDTTSTRCKRCATTPPPKGKQP